ncbi:MAG: hypothetical protein ACKO3N_00290 [Verrucomicrobiota bacterium]
MKHLLLPALVATLSAVSVAWADAKDDLKAAARKLADAPGYTWVATTEIEGGNWTPVPITGKADKSGFAVVSQERDGNTTVAVLKGEKGVVKTDDGWQTAEELRAGASGGGGGRGGMRGAALLRSRPIADEAAKMADKTRSLTVAADGAIGGDLTEEGAKELMALGRGGRQGGGGFEPKNAKGSVKYWVKDGQLSKVQVKVSGTISFNGEDRDMARTTVYEIKDVGATRVEVPEEARKKLGS